MIVLDKGYIPDELLGSLKNTSFSLKEYKTMLYSKQITFPRLMDWYGKVPYSFSNMTIRQTQPTPQAILDCFKYLKESLGVESNCVLLNHYRDGEDYISWHSDDESLFSREHPIVTLSLGGERIFKTREKQNHKNIQTYSSDEGSFIIMPPHFQSTHEHHIPKSKTLTQPRTSFTFRHII